MGALCGKGRPKVGYKTETLIKCLEGYFETERTKAVLLGCGHFGRALLDFSGFDDLGLDISAGFDENILKAEKIRRGRPVLPMSDFCEILRRKRGVPRNNKRSARRRSGRFRAVIRKRNKGGLVYDALPSFHPPDAVVEYENMVASSAYLKMQIDQRRTK